MISTQSNMTIIKRSNSQLLRFILLVLLTTILSACSEPPYSNLNNTELDAMLKQNVPVYDIRRADEWRQTGIIKDSELLTFVDTNGRINADFMNRFTAAIKQNDPVILICRTGNRSSTLARHLVEQMGYTQVFNVRNGITQWIRDKRPVKHL
jgi:rhodanese-related sulfurtransferase